MEYNVGVKGLIACLKCNIRFITPSMVLAITDLVTISSHSNFLESGMTKRRLALVRFDDMSHITHQLDTTFLDVM